jgi:hypothetical protein
LQIVFFSHWVLFVTHTGYQTTAAICCWIECQR